MNSALLNQKLLLSLAIGIVIYVTYIYMAKSDFTIELAKYPNGKNFAFTVTDDPDYGWLEQKYAVYDFLSELGIKTTIPVWVMDNKHGTGIDGENHKVGGITTTNKLYLEYIKALKKKGYEIALHTVGPGNDLREETLQGYELFKEHFGDYPKININHTTNLENIYWGKYRFNNFLMRFMYGFLQSNYFGHIKDSKYFWGDISKQKTKYIRSWATDRLNTLSVNTSMPYHEKKKPYVNYWFGCSDGYNYEKYMRLVSDSNIEELVEERGTAIIYTHFAYGFYDKEKNVLDEKFKTQMTKLAQLDGWFVPVSTILDRFLALREVNIFRKGEDFIIANSGKDSIEGLTILTNKQKLYIVNENKWVTANNDGEIILGTLRANQTIKLSNTNDQVSESTLGYDERIKLVWNWIVGRFNQ